MMMAASMVPMATVMTSLGPRSVGARMPPGPPGPPAPGPPFPLAAGDGESLPLAGDASLVLRQAAAKHRIASTLVMRARWQKYTRCLYRDVVWVGGIGISSP